MASTYTILSVGGSILVPKTGFDIPFLRQFRRLLLEEVKKGSRFILVIGGGSTCRIYQDAVRSVSRVTNEDVDWMGIHTTVLNAKLCQAILGDVVHKDILTNPTKKVHTSKPIIIAAGWKPGRSTDYVAVALAKTYKASHVANLSNIPYVYTKDPRVHPDAEHIEDISWSLFRKRIVGYRWAPGKSAPFDPVASEEAERLGLTVSIIQGTNIPEVRKMLRGSSFVGTNIHP